MANNTAIPVTSKDVLDRKFIRGQAGPSVEEARAAMLAAKEPVTTVKGGTRIPKFVQETGSAVPPAVQSHADLLASAHTKINNLHIPIGSKINLIKMRDAGLITQPEIDALMAEANGTAPKAPVEEPAPAVDVNSLIEPAETNNQPAVVTEVPRVAATPAAPVERVPVEQPSDRRIRQEDKSFVVEIYRNGKEWAAELTYKNGAGTELFTANSKDDLMLKLAVGKANASLKVRKLVRDGKLGNKPDSWDFFFEQVKESHGLTVEQYNALPEASRALVQDTIQAQQILAFTETHPEYYATANNFKTIADWLNNKEIPLTMHNLELAYNDLIEDELLEVRPKPAASAAATVPVVPVAPVVEDSAPAVAAPASPVPTVVATAPPATAPRKRGSTGLIPGSSSALPVEVVTEEGIAPKEPSMSELKNMSDADLKRIATKNRVYPKY